MRRVAAGHCATTLSDDPHDLAARLDWVRRELRGIDRVAAEIIELRFRGGLTLRAIGDRLGMSIGAVHARMTRAIGKLRQRASEQRDD